MPKGLNKSMVSNKATNNKLEIKFRKKLWKNNIRGYRKNYSILPGKPDIYFPKRKIAIFVNGCFWHSCPYCKPQLPKTNQEFWINKFEGNKARDKKNKEDLKKLGLTVFVLWECRIEKDGDKIISKLRKHFY